VIYLWYLILVPINLVITLLAVILAPILPLFATEQEGWLDNHSRWGVGPRLIKLLSVFMTPDNSLDGDATFERLNPPSYWSKVKWLWRNPAYSFGLKYLHNPYYTKVQGDPSIKDNDNAKAGWCLVHANGLFQFRWVQPIGFQRCLYVNLGWNVIGLVDPNVNPKPDPWQATFVFSPRLSGFR
jgi:hypothetical protein